MKLIEQYVELVDEIDGISILKKLERIGRVCYASTDNITENSYINFITNILKQNHLSVIEHANITIKWVTDRAIANELVRHRLASFSQSSTRYIDSSKSEMEFIKPVDFEFNLDEINHLISTEYRYNGMIYNGKSPQQARSILPNCLKTEIIFTMNLRELRYMLKLRCAKSSHPQMRDIAKKTLKLLSDKIPIIFDDLVEEFLSV